MNDYLAPFDALADSNTVISIIDLCYWYERHFYNGNMNVTNFHPGFCIIAQVVRF
jgi:hypothetical protein